MGLLSDVVSPLAELAPESKPIFYTAAFFIFIVITVIVNVLSQLLFRDPREPPLVFHWFPLIGNTIAYGIDPFKFFFSCREKYGDVFTFVLLGSKKTVYLGTKGNNFILNGRHADLSAEEIYGIICTPVFGKDVVYDCPNAKLMEQKKFVKFGLTTEALNNYVKLIADETQSFMRNSSHFKGDNGKVNVPIAMSELTIYTASGSLQGKEVRQRFDSTFAKLFRELDMGFTPINFVFPWFPFPHNRRRDYANQKLSELYTEIIQKRREAGTENSLDGSEDMIWNLMSCRYKNGSSIPDHEIAHMMIALLMAGQHSSSSTISWALLYLAYNPHVTEELLDEQRRVLGKDLPPVTYADMARLPLHSQTIRETLRMKTPIHSIMRTVKQPLVVDGTNYVIPPGRIVIAAPGVTSQSSEHFPNPDNWDPHRWNTYTNPDEADDEKVDYGFGTISKGGNSPYLPFGAGRHRCIGEQFAYVQLQTILANIVREVKIFKLEECPNMVETDYSSMFSGPLKPACVKFERRNV